MPTDIKDFAPTLAQAQIDPATVKEKLSPAKPAKEPKLPKLTSRQMSDILTWYSAGEKDPEQLARMAVADPAAVGPFVSELSALAEAIAVKPDDELVNTYKPEPAQPIGDLGGVKPIGGDEELKP